MINRLIIAYILVVIIVKKKSKNTDDIIVYANEPHLHITGNSECVVDGLKGIVEYTSQKIKINLGKYFVTFLGDDLYINSFSHEGAVVQGIIVSMEFESNG
jgi:sporulation protein YqfC